MSSLAGEAANTRRPTPPPPAAPEAAARAPRESPGSPSGAPEPFDITVWGVVDMYVRTAWWTCTNAQRSKAAERNVRNWSVVEATRDAAVGLALRYPTSAEMHVLTDRGERELQGVADLFRRLSADVTRSDESRARLTGRADHLEHQIRRARERRALGEE